MTYSIYYFRLEFWAHYIWIWITITEYRDLILDHRTCKEQCRALGIFMSRDVQAGGLKHNVINFISVPFNFITCSNPDNYRIPQKPLFFR